MSNVARSMSMGATIVAIGVVMVVAFLWAGPGAQALFGTASASVLFDEQQVVNVYERVSPAVVEVTNGTGTGPALQSQGSGSGFLIDSEGHIVTNNHVVEGASRLTVRLSNGTSVEATIVGTNPANDLALLKVDASSVEGILPVPLGDSSGLKPGQMAIAIGNPFGLEGSITVGVISQVGRDLPSSLGRPISNVVQTDALINPGNSGGPLLDSSGNVVGINTAIQLSPLDGSSRGIGFAVPVDTLKNVLPRLKTEAIVRPAWLGVRAADIDAQLAERLELPVDSGVYVMGVSPDSPAEEAGLVEALTDARGRASTSGDIITAVDGVAVDSTAELISQLNAAQAGNQVTLTVIRGDETIQVVVTLAEWPDPQVTTERRFERSPRERSPFPRDESRPFPRPNNGIPPNFFEEFFGLPFPFEIPVPR